MLLELNLGSSVRVDLGLTYRYVTGVQVDGLDAMDLSGPGLLVLAKFGKL